MLAILLLTCCGQFDAQAALDASRKHIAKREFNKAAEVLGKAAKENPENASLPYWHGRALFRAGKVKESSAAFDQHVKLAPRLESRQWERGISHYYAGRYKDGAKQFELYQTYHDSDVENSVWRFLCMVPTHGVEKSRKVMLPIEGDRRPAMMKVFELYRGTAKEADIWKELEAEGLPAVLKESGSFYAHLYLGLYYEVLKKTKEAKKHIELAADEKYLKNPRVNSYMWDVARIHKERLVGQKKSAKKESAAKK